MEIIAKEISMSVINIFDQISAIYKFYEEFETFTKEYLREHPDEIDNIYTVFKCSNPSISVIIEGIKILNYREKIVKVFILTNDKLNKNQKIVFEAIMKKRLQLGEDEILFRNTILRPEKNT